MFSAYTATPSAPCLGLRVDGDSGWPDCLHGSHRLQGQVFQQVRWSCSTNLTSSLRSHIASPTSHPVGWYCNRSPPSLMVGTTGAASRWRSGRFSKSMWQLWSPASSGNKHSHPVLAEGDLSLAPICYHGSAAWACRVTSTLQASVSASEVRSVL